MSAALADYLRLKDLRQLGSWVGLALRTITGAGRSLAAATWAFAIVFGLLPVATSVAMANLIGAAPGVARAGLDSPAGSRMVVAATVYVVLLALAGLVQAIAGAVVPWVGRQVDGRIRERAMRAALRPAGVAHLDEETVRSALDQARSAAPTSGVTPGTIAGLVPRVVGGRITLLGYLIGLTYLAPPIGLAFFLLTLKTQDEMQKGVWRVAGGRGQPPPATAYQLDLGTTAGPGKELRVFGLGHWVAERFRTGLVGHIDTIWGARRDFTPGLVGALVASAALTIVGLSAIGAAGVDGALTVGQVAFAVVAVMAVNPGGAFNQDDMPFAFAARAIESLEAAERAVAGVSGKQPGLDVGDRPAHVITFEDVHFRYPGAEVDVLKGVSFELRVGERCALVGLNGAGKTTLVKLLCGLYQPTAGAIRVDGQPLAEIDPVSWRRRIAVLFQEFAQYELSARDNIRYGALTPDGVLDVDAAVRRAAEQAGIARAIEALPAGWDSPLSPGYPDGASLSGGQWQRVALARALFAVEAGGRVLVLDEPSASLDVRAEAELYERLLDLTSGTASGRRLATLLISHRFSTVRQADRILVLADGVIAESGSHDDLLAHRGLYERMFQAQAEQFAPRDGGADAA